MSHEKFFYALSDSFTGDNPAQPTSGFANSKEVIAFTTKKERGLWLTDTKLTTAISLTRKDAERFANKVSPENYQGLNKNYEWAKAARIYRSQDWINRTGGLVWPEYTALKYSAN